jgi:hypothetical protein
MVIVQEALAKEVEEERIILIATSSRKTIPDVLERIADCESGARNTDGSAIRGSGRHTDEHGEVILGKLNRPELGVDIGKYQINEHFHGARAVELGLDLRSEADNEAYALVLYEESGTRPWKASESCWNRE